jgi:hypothetical protein
LGFGGSAEPVELFVVLFVAGSAVLVASFDAVVESALFCCSCFESSSSLLSWSFVPPKKLDILLPISFK